MSAEKKNHILVGHVTTYMGWVAYAHVIFLKYVLRFK